MILVKLISQWYRREVIGDSYAPFEFGNEFSKSLDNTERIIS